MDLVLVTGASRGIGRELARELIAQGFEVIGIGRSQKDLVLLEQELGPYFHPVVCDVSSKEVVACVSKDLKEKGLYPSIFYLNAGLVGEEAMESASHFSLNIHRKIFDVNYFGVLAWVEEWQTKKRTVKFIVTSSVNALFASPLTAGYAASKAAITKAFEGLTLTYPNMHFTSVIVGPVDTGVLKVYEKRRLPFTWSAPKMGKYLAKIAYSRKTRHEPFFFYSTVSRISNLLPKSVKLSLLRHFVRES